MKIKSVNIAQDKYPNGLMDIRMSRLGQVVLLAGKNGAGKSRILDKIKDSIAQKPTKSQVENAIQERSHALERIKRYKNTIAELQKTMIADPQKYYHDAIIKNEKQIAKDTTSIDTHTNTISWGEIHTDALREAYPVVPFVPKTTKLTDANTFTKQQLIQIGSATDKIGINALQKSTFAKIQIAQDRWFNATHPASTMADEEKEDAIAKYEELKNLITIFLGTSVERNGDNEVTLFGFPSSQSNMSEGQTILLQFCIAIFDQKESLNDLILFMDEPENHLHPSAIIEIMERIRRNNVKGQIWIATHSIPLLSHFDPSMIWYVNDGSVSHAGKNPQEVLSSLLGKGEELSKLRSFINLPVQYALDLYSFESLFTPSAVLTGFDDPQMLQARTEISQHQKEQAAISILDFGAGKCRLLQNMIDHWRGTEREFSDRFNYVAYDPNSTDRDFAAGVIEQAYRDTSLRYYNSLHDLRSDHTKSSFDIAVFTNVLHEIDPKEWLKVFEETGDLASLLHGNGVLLIVEDHEMPFGEKAYENGFIVLDTAELKTLFHVTADDDGFSYNVSKQNLRLKSHIIPRNCMVRVTAQSRTDAIAQVKRHAHEQILSIRTDKMNYENGRRMAFWLQQFANSSIALSEFGNSTRINDGKIEI